MMVYIALKKQNERLRTDRLILLDEDEEEDQPEETEEIFLKINEGDNDAVRQLLSADPDLINHLKMFRT